MGLSEMMKQGIREDYITRSFIMNTTPNVIRKIRLRKLDWGGACGPYGGEGRCIQDFGGENYGIVTTWEDNIKMAFQEEG